MDLPHVGAGNAAPALRPQSLGNSAHYLRQFLRLTPVRKTPLLDVSTSLLSQVQRPVPHYLGRLFEFEVPVELVPPCAEINVSD